MSEDYKTIRVPREVYDMLNQLQADLARPNALSGLPEGFVDLAMRTRAKNGGWPLGGIVQMGLELVSGSLAKPARKSKTEK